MFGTEKNENEFIKRANNLASLGYRVIAIADGKIDNFKLKDEYIKLGQALKASGLAESGVDAKFAVLDGLVKVNGQVELQRGKKLTAGDIVEYRGEKIKIV